MTTPIRTCFNCGNLKGCAGCSAECEAPVNAVCAPGEDRPSHWQPKPEIAEMSARLDLALKAEAIVDRLLERAAVGLRQTAASARPEVDAPVEVDGSDRLRARADGWCSVEDVERLLSGTDIWAVDEKRAAIIRVSISRAWRGILTVFPTLPEKTRENELAHIQLAGAFAWAFHAPYIGERQIGTIGGEQIMICSRATGAETARRWFNDALKQLRTQGADATLIKEIAE